MKKTILSFTAFVALFITAAAQPPKGMGTSDPAAKKILDGVSAKFKTYKAVTAKFNIKIENAAGKSQGSKSGTVYIKGTKYRVSITGKEVFCDGTNVWTYDKVDNEVVITKVDGSNNTITPQKMFTNFYDKDFLYKLNGEAGGQQEIELTPIDKSKAFHKVIVKVNKATQAISSTKVFEKAGNRFTTTVTSMNTTAAVADTQFVFDAKKYPGVEVIDNR